MNRARDQARERPEDLRTRGYEGLTHGVTANSGLRGGYIPVGFGNCKLNRVTRYQVRVSGPFVCNGNPLVQVDIG